jgi:hypothetical protein
MIKVAEAKAKKEKIKRDEEVYERKMEAQVPCMCGCMLL